MSTAARLRESFSTITDKVAELIKQVPVKWLNRRGHGIVIVAPEFYWGDKTPAQKYTQLKLKRNFDELMELLHLIFKNSPKEIERPLKQAEAAFRKWIEFGENWSLSQDRAANEAKLREDASQIAEILEILASPDADVEPLVVPDTNAIINHPDPGEYAKLIGMPKFTFLILPTVLGELDKLKLHHKDPLFREKVSKVISRIKGWRKQGPLTEGITVNKTITVRTVAKEPDMTSTLSWLDRDVLDDRIIANVLEVYADQPEAKVVLVTGDINLQNKAEAAKVEYADFE